LKNQPADFPAKDTDMTYAQTLGIFFILLAGIIIVPGMDMIFVLANALTGGRKAGLGLMASRGRNAMFGNPTLTIWTGRIAGLLLVATALFTTWHGWRGL
jgi:threonine/homoserine/homoserine lactone efflux protein